MLSQEQCLWWEMFWTSLLTWWVWFYILRDAGNCQLVSNFSQREIVYKLLLYCCVCRGKEDFICHLADFTLLGRTIFLTTLNFSHYKILMEKVVLAGGGSDIQNTYYKWLKIILILLTFSLFHLDNLKFPVSIRSEPCITLKGSRGMLYLYFIPSKSNILFL